jgi:hypothetical protein
MEQRHRRYNAGRANNGVADYVNIYHKQPATGNYAVAGCLFVDHKLRVSVGLLKKMRYKTASVIGY